MASYFKPFERNLNPSSSARSIRLLQPTRRALQCLLPVLMVHSGVTLFPDHVSMAQDEPELYDVLQSAQQTLDAVIQEATDGEFGLAYELASPDEFNRALLDFQTAMQGGDLETMAEWLPNASELMSFLDSTPGFEPYADWLRQRLDYAAVANEAVNAIGQTPSDSETRIPEQPVDDTPKVPASEPKVQDAVEPQPSGQTAEPVTETVQSKQRLAYARNAETWSKKLSGRPVVPAAAELVPPLKKIFSEQGVPEELVWIAEVESTFNPAARSPAGAVGLFQLMPNTAKHLELEIEPEDQRLDPWKNGQAAARYLSDLHQRFEDWPLAIAAYNGGEGRVSKLLKASNARNLDAITEQLPGQTQMYVPKVLATIREREGYDPLTRW